MSKIVLTADRATMSHYNHNMYLGFLSCLPDRLCPEWIYNTIVPDAECNDDGTVKLPNLSLRAVESILVNSGFDRKDVNIVHPDFLESRITDDTKIVGISTHDPLGLGPATTTWSTIFLGTPWNRIHFLQLMERIRDLKQKRKFKVVLGGPGDWQINKPETMDELGIDNIVMGEGEISVPKSFNDIINGNDGNDRIITDRVPRENEIPSVLGPSSHDLIEITRGCGRGCDFCAPTTSGSFRNLPMEKILGDLKVYLDRGMTNVIFQSEDSLRYGSKDLLADKDALLNLFKECFDAGAKHITITHASFVNFAHQPDVIEALTKLINDHGMRYFGCQPGLETGSQRLISRYMKGKVYPRDPEEWHEIVYEGLKVMKKHNWYPICTLICGLPEEHPEDIKLTIDLIKKVKDFEALYIPLFFAPMSMIKLKERERFIADHMRREHWELMLACWDHNFRHIYNMYKLVSSAHNPAFKFFVKSLTTAMKVWVNIKREQYLNLAYKTKA